MSESYDLTLAANQGATGGGEVMLLEVASTARDLGLRVRVVAPAEPSDLLDAAAARGLDVVALPGDRRAYARALRAWDRQRRGLLWTVGLLPTLATAGHPDRVAHLHQLHTGPKGWLARAATRRTRRVLVPSQWVADRMRGASVLPNWTAPVPFRPRTPGPEPIRIGYLGRLVLEKGITDLAAAVAELDRRTPGRYRLVLGGQPVFAGSAERRTVDAALAPVDHLVDRRGWVRPEDFFPTVDLAVFPSVAAESFGLVAAEAMAAGVPFVTTDAGALPEVIGPDHPWVVPPRQPQRIADAVEQVLAAGPARERHVEASRRRWEARFSPEHGRESLRALLDELGLPAAAEVSR